MQLRHTLPLVAALALALAACGVKGPLEPPPNPQASGTQGAAGQATPAATGPARPTATNMPNSPTSEAREVTQEGEVAWGANPAATYTYVPPNTPGDSVSRPAPKGGATNPATAKKPFFLDFLL
ncbi:LPS translocon maturation chaperone LptM [Aquabacter sp. L1I39]|uniref:LPS translocon maturation chaperone LptM n=1 Tax=Aquabacter sp. L1I39 TaxID=2820278 RepID=UPI001FFCF658|nr:lipoprotein [Aquabacter sp. L1I39]